MNFKTLWIAKGFCVLSLFGLLLTGCKKNKNKSKIDAPKQQQLNEVKSERKIVSEPNGGLFFPEGFSAIVVADSVGPARHLAVNSNGDIYIKLKTETGRNGNMALRDTTGDGRADIFQKWGDYPNDGRFATEMRIHNNYIYFSSEQVIYRQKLTVDKLVPEGSPETLLTDNYPKRWHNAKSLAFDKKGNMYVTFSAPTNACEDLESQAGNVQGLEPCPLREELGSIWKFSESKQGQFQKDGELYATGVRSMVAISWNDDDNSLYGLQHGRDYLNNHAPHHFSEWHQAVLPAEEFMQLKKGDDFGWPYTYYDHFKKKKMYAPEYGGDGEKEAKKFKAPLMGLPAHWAPNDLLFYRGNQFPARYKKGAFVAFHGSTNRAPYPQAGYIVGFLPFEDGKPNGTWEVFADGFTGVETVRLMKDAKFRPVGLAEGPDGSLYISESNKGKIWRVKYDGDSSLFNEEHLAAMEKHKLKSHLKIPDEITDNLSLK